MKDMESKKSNEEMYYTARDLALILNGFALDCQSEAEMMERIWEKERAYLREPYRTDKRKLYLDTLYWARYYYEKESLDSEFQDILTDLQDSGSGLKEEDYISDFADVDLFFKTTRLRLLYGQEEDYVRLKRRTLLNQLHAQRLRPQIAKRIQTFLRFYRLGMFMRGGIPCRLEDTKPDDTIVLRIATSKANKSGVQKVKSSR